MKKSLEISDSQSKAYLEPKYRSKISLKNKDDRLRDSLVTIKSNF
jgi:hypothetical protein